MENNLNLKHTKILNLKFIFKFNGIFINGFLLNRCKHKKIWTVNVDFENTLQLNYAISRVVLHSEI